MTTAEIAVPMFAVGVPVLPLLVGGLLIAFGVLLAWRRSRES